MSPTHLSLLFTLILILPILVIPFPPILLTILIIVN
ncbi:hypothetical protein, partial [Bacillus pumilus]